MYCASSQACDPEYRRDARRLGAILARAGVAIVYGGGAVGSMGALADGALAEGGEVIGVIPHFMVDLEWAHNGISRLDRVEDMRIRKHRMLEGSDAVIALPGGCGTFEELFEVLTLKRLGIYKNPIVLLNTRGYFDAAASLLDRAVSERFMDRRHAAMWTIVASPAEILPAIGSAPAWPVNALDFAAVEEPD